MHPGFVEHPLEAMARNDAPGPPDDEPPCRRNGQITAVMRTPRIASAQTTLMASSELPGCRRGHGQACQLGTEPPEDAGGAVVDALTIISSIMYGLLRWLRGLDLAAGHRCHRRSAVVEARYAPWQKMAELGAEALACCIGSLGCLPTLARDVRRCAMTWAVRHGDDWLCGIGTKWPQRYGLFRLMRMRDERLR